MAGQQGASNGSSSHADKQTSRRNEAVRLYKAGDFHGAVNILEQVVREPPVDYASYYELGRALAKIERSHDALTAFRRALELNPSSAAVLHELGVGLRRSGRLSDAATELSKAIKLRPRQIPSYLELARVLDQHRKPEEAVAVLRDALHHCETENERGEVTRALEALEGGNERHARGQPAERPPQRRTEPPPGTASAPTDFEKSLRAEIEANPAVVAPRVALGNVLRKANRFAEAVQELQRAIELAPDSFEANLELGHALRQLGDNPAARVAFSTAFRLKPQRAPGRGRSSEIAARTLARSSPFLLNAVSPAMERSDILERSVDSRRLARMPFLMSLVSANGALARTQLSQRCASNVS